MSDGGDLPVVRQADIEQGLRRLGLRAGDTVVVHSALRSFGWVDGAEDAVIDALLAVVEPAGTVCMPCLTYGTFTPRHPPPPFDPERTPGIVGRIPERFRTRAGVARSLHPTHSVAAQGVRAAALLADHDRSDTPCGPQSPWGRIAAADGRVLMLGVGLFYCTMCHGPEEVAEPDARCTRPIACPLVVAGQQRLAWLRLHRPYRGALSDREALEPLLAARGLLRRALVGHSTLRLIEAGGLWELGLELLRRRPCRRWDQLAATVEHRFHQVRRSLHG